MQQGEQVFSDRILELMHSSKKMKPSRSLQS